jgi:4-amino-4-deoxy-L-arabinose transferase-like glycosyltransferase
MLKQLAGFLAISIGLRAFTFFRSVIDHDESTYIVIGDAILHGAKYWVDIIDVKPIGIFWLYAGFQAIFGHSIFAMRLMAALWLALTAFFMAQFKLELGSSPRAAYGAGILFILLNSLFTFYGISPNTETFFTFFTMLAFWLALRYRNPIGWFIAGVALGLGFIIKYVILFDALALGLFLVGSPGVRLTHRLQWLVVMVVGAALPFAGVLACYAHWGAVDKFLFYTFQVSKNYPVQAELGDHLKSFADLNLLFFPVALLFYLTLGYAETPSHIRRLGILWSTMVLIPVLLPGKFFGHYYIQFFLPFSFVAGEFFSRSKEEVPRLLRPFFRPSVAIPLLGTFLALHFFFQKKDYIDRLDTPKVLAKTLQGKMREGDQVYAGNFHHILYFLLRQQSPTPYVHRSLLWSEDHRKALNIQAEDEIHRIFAQKPTFVIVQDSIADPLFKRLLQKDYIRSEAIKNERGRPVYLYKKSSQHLY